MCSSGTKFPYHDTCIYLDTKSTNLLRRLRCKEENFVFITVSHIDLINNKIPKPVREFRAEIIKMLIVLGNWPSNLNKTHPALCVMTVMWCFISDATRKWFMTGITKWIPFFGSLFASGLLFYPVAENVLCWKIFVCVKVF